MHSFNRYYPSLYQITQRVRTRPAGCRSPSAHAVDPSVSFDACFGQPEISACEEDRRVQALLPLIERAVLNRLRDMRRIDQLTIFQIRDRPRNLQDAVMGPNAQAQRIVILAQHMLGVR